MNLWSHQKFLLERSPDKIGVFFDTGLGKSLTLIELCKQKSFSVLIITPKSLKYKWQVESKDIGVPCTVITRDELKRMYKTLPYHDTVVVEEADYGHFSWCGIHRALMSYITKHNPPHIFLATATPYRSKPENIYYAGKILGYFPYSLSTFKENTYHKKFLGKTPIPFPNIKHTSQKVRDEAQAFLFRYMSNFADIVRREDVFGLPDVIHAQEIIGLTPKQEKYLTKLKENTESNSSLFVYANELENGYIGDKAFGEQVDFVSLKEERVMELIEQHGSLLVYAKYRVQQKQLFDRVSKKYECYLLNGDNSNESSVLAKKLNDSVGKEKPVVLIASPEIASGWEVPDLRFAVYASLPYGYSAYTQSRDRIIRGEGKGKYVIKYLIGGKTDAQIFSNLMQGIDTNPSNYTL